MSKATTQRLSERMATRTPPAPARGAPRPPQEHIQPLPYHDSTETQGSPLSPGDSKHGPRSRRPFQPPPNQGGRGGGGVRASQAPMAAAGPRTTGPRFPSGRPPSGQAEQGNRGEGAAGGALPGTPAAAAGPPGTHLRPAAEAGPRGPGSLREEPGPSRSCSPRDPFAGPAPPSPEAKEPAVAGAAPRPRAPAGGGASRRVVTSPRPPRGAVARLHAHPPASRSPSGRGVGGGDERGRGGAYAYVSPAVLLLARDRLLRKSGRWVRHVVEAALRPPS